MVLFCENTGVKYNPVDQQCFSRCECIRDTQQCFYTREEASGKAWHLDDCCNQSEDECALWSVTGAGDLLNPIYLSRVRVGAEMCRDKT
jgi:hypothetical protein